MLNELLAKDRRSDAGDSGRWCTVLAVKHPTYVERTRLDFNLLGDGLRDALDPRLR